MVLVNVTCLKGNSQFPTPTFQMKTFLVSSSCQQIAPLFVIFGYCLFLHAHMQYTGRSFCFYLQRIFRYAYFISFTTTLVQASVFRLQTEEALEQVSLLFFFLQFSHLIFFKDKSWYFSSSKLPLFLR